jgi:hypothetical protein
MTGALLTGAGSHLCVIPDRARSIPGLRTTPLR